MTYKTSICARYKLVDGWHVFSSDDLPGLYVANRDPEIAFNDVGPSIEKLIKLDAKVECKVAPETPLREFLSNVRHHEEMVDMPLVMSDRRFFVGVAA